MKKYYIILGCLFILVSLNALAAGYSLVTRPDGTGLGMSTGMLSNSPFPDFFIPGLFLLVVHGFGSAAGAVVSFMRRKSSAITGMLLGAVLVLWIILQVAWIGLNHFLQPLLLIIGASEAFLGWKIKNISQAKDQCAANNA